VIKRPVAVFIFSALMLVARVSLAQDQTPERIVQLQMEAMARNDWGTYTSFMHPDALGSFKEIFRMMISADDSGEMVGGLFGVLDSTEYDKKSAADIFMNFMRGINQAAPELMGIAKDASYQILGSVPEGSETVHVVFRMTLSLEGIPISSVAVQTLHKYNGQWKSLLSKQMDDLISLIKQMQLATGEEEE
jgi:hypothetical protein